MGPKEKALFEQFITQFKSMNQFDKHWGLEFTIISPGHIKYRMPIQDIHFSSPQTVHGGVIGGMMDAVLGLSALGLAILDGNLVSTIEYKLNFLSPVQEKEILVGEGKVQFKGQSIIVSDGIIQSETTKKIVSRGMGTFNVYPLNKKISLMQKIIPTDSI